MDTFFSPTANCRVRWLDLPGNGVPLVFVHGLGCASSCEYPRVVIDSAFAGRRAILIDLPGYGYSEKPKDYRYTIADQAQVVVQLVAHLNLQRFFLYGHSMGGSIAIEAATLMADKLCGLLLSEPNFHPGGGFFSRQICSVSEESWGANGHHATVENETSAWAASLSVAAPEAVWRGAYDLIKGNDWMTLFRQLTVAKCLIFGEQSLPDANFSALRVMGIDTRVLADCGHSMSWENPSALAGALSDFCQKNERQ